MIRTNMREAQEVNKIIGQMIRQLRLSKKITIQELAYRCEIERSNMSRIELGRTNLTIKTLCRVCAALDVTLGDVFRDID